MTRDGPLVVIGDALLDRDVEGAVERLCPDAPAPVLDERDRRSRPGGAALAATLAAARGDQDVVLITGLSTDEAGAELHDLLAAGGVRVVDMGLDGPTPEKIRVRTGDRSLLRLDRNCLRTSAVGALPEAARTVLAQAAAVLIADYGRGVTGEPSLRDGLARLDRRVPVVWDPHPRGAVPVAGCRLVTPNRSEAARFAPDHTGDGLAGHAARGHWLRARWEAAAVAVTMGADGALVVEGDGAPLVVPAPAVDGGDPCGAGDRFAAEAAALLAHGALVSEAVAGAIEAASAFVAAGGAGALRLPDRGEARRPAPPASADDLVRQVRAAGGTVVATGGCFDILHAGHVALLTGARALGDCLVVCLNSDASVRRLKGAGRPRASQADRAAVLLALECVDAVALFDEDTPSAVLERLRPDIFVKGGDYAGAQLPEAAVLAGWGGQVAVLPYLAGRSTTRLLQEVRAHDS